MYTNWARKVALLVPACVHFPLPNCASFDKPFTHVLDLWSFPASYCRRGCFRRLCRISAINRRRLDINNDRFSLKALEVFGVSFVHVQWWAGNGRRGVPPRDVVSFGGAVLVISCNDVPERGSWAWSDGSVIGESASAQFLELDWYLLIPLATHTTDLHLATSLPTFPYFPSVKISLHHIIIEPQDFIVALLLVDRFR